MRDNDPKKYWSILSDLSHLNNVNVSEISGKKWLNYFKELNEGFKSSNTILNMLKEKEKLEDF
jgi:hypothetical protein